MILTLTMNPSLDISYPLKHLVINNVNRIDDAKKTAGGKGLNVARVIQMAQKPVIATGLLGGHIGQYIQDELAKDSIAHQFLSINQESRHCIAILHDSAQTEILESGPTINQQDQQAFKQHFANLIAQADVVTMSGSLPKGIAANYYAQLIDIANKQHKKVLLDCSGQALKEALQHHEKPYLIKPNHEELGLLVNKTIDATNVEQISDILLHAPELQAIPLIIVSLGQYGALARYQQQIWRVSIPRINVINPVGSGDATLAGLAIALSEQSTLPTLLKRAMVFGMLNALEAKTGAINLAHYDALFKQIEVNLYPSPHHVSG
ncbi:tagatose 6-phosphate kinase [Orbus hercynius]|uniref:Phosphofructokinase n=1 Tax=Orbus hercynius TaxID=593135 RepID=A0A495RBK0_9GAMM|nr:hexose kinase [Orbus hercynius]RKS84785.1 tagatose 6-phosphate kinase [Orbus hercynius]